MAYTATMDAVTIGTGRRTSTPVIETIDSLTSDNAAITARLSRGTWPT